MSGEKRPKSSGALGSLRDKYNTWRQKRDASLDFSSPEGSQKSKNSSKNGSYTPNPSQASGQTYHDNNNHMNQASAFNYNTDTNNSPQMAPRRVPQNTDQKKKLQTLTSLDQKSQDPNNRHPSCQFHSEKRWLELQYNKKTGQIMKPNELEDYMKQPPDSIDEDHLYRIQGSMVGMALGDALGAHVEFRPRQYLLANPVRDLVGGGTWGLAKGQFTDDTSMALCLANSLVTRKDFCPYDQLVRYKWWYQLGYMSSTGECFDIGNATRQSIDEFHRRQKRIMQKKSIPIEDIDFLSDPSIIEKFKIYCSEDGVAGNGALMRLAPVPLFFFRHPTIAVEYSGISGQITHGDVKAYDACRYYGALIVAALRGYAKDDLLDKDFYSKHRPWFGDKPLCSDVQNIAEGSYQKKGGYKDGIRGKGYIVAALEAALWAFWSDKNSFEKGALKAVNLGDDTDTTAAIYGQLAGAYYGYKNLPEKWLEHVYAHNFMLNLSEWIAYEGKNWKPSGDASLSSEGAPNDAVTNGSCNPIVTDLLQHEQFVPTQKPTGHNNDADKYTHHEPHEAGTSPTQTTLDRNKSKHPQMTNCNNDEINSTYKANASASITEPVRSTKKKEKSGREHKN